MRRGERTAAAGAEIRAEPRWRLGAVDLGLAAAAELDADGDVWAGGGLMLTAPLAGTWRFEASFMPGIYSEGSGNNLGGGAPIFRTQLGASTELAAGLRLGFAASHKSNADIHDRNPGVETLLITLARRF